MSQRVATRTVLLLTTCWIVYALQGCLGAALDAVLVARWPLKLLEVVGGRHSAARSESPFGGANQKWNMDEDVSWFVSHQEQNNNINLNRKFRVKTRDRK